MRFRGSHLYPLFPAAVATGAFTAGLAFLVGLSLLTAISLWGIFIMAGALWRRDVMPIVPFSLFYQCMFVLVGYIYLQLTGVYPTRDPVGRADNG